MARILSLQARLSSCWQAMGTRKLARAHRLNQRWPMKPVIPFVQLYAFVMPTTDTSEQHVGGPCDERLAIRYQVWGWHPGGQTWIRTLYDGDQLDEAEQAAREWHEMTAGKLGSSNLVDVPSNETLFAWADDLRRLRRMESPE